MSLFSLKVLFFLTFVANYYFTEVERSLCMYTLFRFVAFAKRKRRRERMKVKKPKGVFDKFKYYLVCYFSSRQLIKRKKTYYHKWNWNVGYFYWCRGKFSCHEMLVFIFKDPNIYRCIILEHENKPKDLPERSGIHPRFTHTMIISTEWAPYFCFYCSRR